MLSKKLFRPRLAVALFATLYLLAPARAQQTGSPAPPPGKDEEDVVRISTELVQTDVMVFDGSGKFVDGLKPEQFELRVDGKPQQVVFFERIQAGTVNEDAQIAAARGGVGGARAGGAALPLDRGRTVVFFVDDIHLSPSSAVHIRKTIQRFIDEEIGQNDEAAVLSASGQVGFLSQLTDNKAVLRAAANRISTRPYVVRDGLNPVMTEMHAMAIERNDPSVRDYFVEQLMRENPFIKRDMAQTQVESRARNIVRESNAVAMLTLNSLASVVRGFGPLPGRKVLFFVSDGFLVNDNDSSVRDRMRTISDAAARAGVVIYSLDAGGLRTGHTDASDPGAFDPSGRLARASSGEVSAMQAPLFALAADTGGRALVNTNALGRVVSGALKETSLYYLLAWKPEAAGGGSPKYQRIEVAVRQRPDLRVLVRRGFYNGAAPPEPVEKKKKGDKKADDKKADAAPAGPQPNAAERDLLSALHSPLPRAALPTSMAVGYVHGEAEGGVLAVSVELERGALSSVQGEQKSADFDVLGVVIDDRGKPVRQFGQRLSVTPSPAAPESRKPVVYSFSVPLAPGLYQVRAAARDAQSGRTGSAMQWVELPELKKQFAMSSIFLGERTSGQQAAQPKAEEMSRGVLLSVDRRFSRSSHVRFLTFVYNSVTAPAGTPDVALQVQIFRDDQPVFTAPISKLRADAGQDLARLPYMAELSLETFPPGRYVLQLTAIDRAAKTSTSQRTRFVVE
ncbi:MAG TPA: VWA domain-containing protein [Pyrinomonadaceae bacterium]|nr:VWA domain-containing protein [Pyrinomonadaceae bacterium]